MGCSCLQKSSDIENEFDSLRYTEMNEEYQKTENLDQIKKIQKVYREHLNHTYLTNKDLSTTYTHESKIKTEEISQLLKQLPPLNDGVPVELRLPFKFENQAERITTTERIRKYKRACLEIGALFFSGELVSGKFCFSILPLLSIF